MTPRQRKIWARARQDLKSMCPTRKPVVVYVVALDKDTWGEWRSRNKTHAIDIASRLFSIEGDPDLFCARETLVHEWAHALCEEGGHLRESNDHSPMWGLHYADAYRAVFDRFEPPTN